MRKYKMSRKAARRKSMKMGADDLTDLIKSAVKDAMAEGKGDDDPEESKDEGEDPLADIVSDAIDAMNEKRKAAKADEVSEEEANEIIEAVVDAADGTKSDEVDLETVIQDAIDDVNEKRKSRKDDELGDGFADELLDAVSEVMEDDDVEDEEEKSRKSAAPRRQKKSAPRRQPNRKYSNIYFSRKEDPGVVEQKKIPAAIQVARAIKCMDVHGKGDPERAAYTARKMYGDKNMEREFKAMAATNSVGGGFLIPEIYSDQIIELLYPKTVIVELGAQQIPLTNGNLNLPRMTAGTRAQWGGEGRKIATTSPKYGNIRMSAKRLEAIVPQSRELLLMTTYSADALFANDLFRRMQLGLDYGGLYGTGSEFQPMGIANNKEVENIDATKLDNTELADVNGKITADFPVYVSAKAMSKNIDDLHAGWAMNSMLEGVFKNMKTQTGEYIYRNEMMSEGKLCGVPYKVSNQILTDKNGKTDLFFGNWSDLLIGDQMGLETYTTLEGSWTDEQGISHNAFEENLSATRAIMFDDIAVRHGESFMYCKGIKVF
ncbi:phage major capsid protein [Clostridium sp. AM33-3]|uniref:phage major capsid protein n=1 Tax=Clostridium sp. AM33-3 TaxID=2292304 RepID=UPI001FAA7CF8|nr:phage major capsid protein [Clostridium sp. AM33-3]